MAGIGDAFNRMAQWTAHQAGRPATFAAAVTLLVVWAASGPLFGWSDTWQLIVNTSTTIVTFLMVFLIQNTQNRDTAALQLKIDELIRAHESARNRLLRLEELTEDEMEQVHERFLELARAAPRLTEEKG